MTKKKRADLDVDPSEQTLILGQPTIQTAWRPNVPSAPGDETVILQNALPVEPADASEVTEVLPPPSNPPEEDWEQAPTQPMNIPQTPHPEEIPLPTKPEHANLHPEASEKTLVIPPPEPIREVGFPELPRDLAPTQPMPLLDLEATPDAPPPCERTLVLPPPEFRPEPPTDPSAETDPGLAEPLHDIPVAEPKMQEPQLTESDATTALPTGVPTPPVPAAPEAPHSRVGLWIGLGAGVLAVGGILAYFYFRPASAPLAETPAPAPQAAAEPEPEADVPPALRPYLDKAKQGDAKAMHMIAVMYYNGLNVRQDREKGLDWYRKAAAAGSAAAQKELAQIDQKAVK